MNRSALAAASFVVVFALPGTALAYVGPGLGVGALGALLGMAGALVLGLLAVLWYPFKRLLRNRRAARAENR